MVTAQSYIPAAEADPIVAARRVWGERAGWLYTELEAKVALAVDPWLASVRHEEARERLEKFATGDLTRYLRAVDSTLYAAAAGAVRTRLLVRGLRAHHDLLAAGIERLGRTDDAESFAATAHALVGLLNACLHLEREVLAPALTDLAGLDLAGLVADLSSLLAGGAIAPPEPPITAEGRPATRRAPAR